MLQFETESVVWDKLTKISISEHSNKPEYTVEPCYW
jgi:hypothetical protein